MRETWKGDKAVRAANLALAAEATVAELTWARGALAGRRKGWAKKAAVGALGAAAGSARAASEALATAEALVWRGSPGASYWVKIAAEATAHAAKASAAGRKLGGF